MRIKIDGEFYEVDNKSIAKIAAAMMGVQALIGMAIWFILVIGLVIIGIMAA
jgi:hypothetical protein